MLKLASHTRQTKIYVRKFFEYRLKIYPFKARVYFNFTVTLKSLKPYIYSIFKSLSVKYTQDSSTTNSSTTV